MAKIPSQREPQGEGPERGANSGGGPELSPFTARPADADGGTADPDPDLSSLPPARDIGKLRSAAAEMIASGIPLDEAASKFGVDADTLHLYYRTYVKFYGKENFDAAGEFAASGGDFDRTSRRQFERNWAELMYQAEKNRPQLPLLRRKLMAFPLTSWMFVGPFVDRVAVTGAACVVLLGVLAFKLTGSHRGEDRPPQVYTPEPRDPSKGVHQLSRDQETVLHEEIREFLRMFIGLETWEERLPHVRHQDVVAEKMRQFHSRYPDGPMVPVVLDPDPLLISREDGDFALARGTWKRPYLRSDKLTFLIELDAGEAGFLVDWETLVNYEPIPWEDFKAQRSQNPAPFRVRLERGTYYNAPFLDKAAFAGYRLSFPDRPDEEVFAFAERGSEPFEVIERALASELDRDQGMILDLSYPVGARFEDILKIERVASPHW